MRSEEAAVGERTPAIESPVKGAEEMLALDEALARLEELDPRRAEVVMLKYFAGLNHEQIAGALSVSLPTVERDWRFARAWLGREVKVWLGEGQRGDGEVGGDE